MHRSRQFQSGKLGAFGHRIKGRYTNRERSALLLHLDGRHAAGGINDHIVNGADLDDCVIVELEAVARGDVDFDADQGAMLVIPTAIRGCARVDRSLAERLTQVGAAE